MSVYNPSGSGNVHTDKVMGSSPQPSKKPAKKVVKKVAAKKAVKKAQKPPNPYGS